jgi:hypothetical protein
MVQMGVPLGLVVAPKIMAVYRNKYTGISEKSIERIALFDIPESWPVFSRFLHLLPENINEKGPKIALAFEENVQSWLEHMPTSGFLQDLPPEAQAAFSNYILPALNEGIVGAAHPREYSS